MMSSVSQSISQSINQSINGQSMANQLVINQWVDRSVNPSVGHPPTASTWDIPAVGTVSQGTVLPNASFANKAILA